MKLELKHLVPYLPYELMLYKKGFPNTKLTMLKRGHDYSYWKPILRPMSDLDKTILTKDGYRNFAKINELYKDSDGDWVEDVQADQCESPFAQIMVTGINWWLFENHFDVFGLIEKDLAIDINTIEI